MRNSLLLLCSFLVIFSIVSSNSNAQTVYTLDWASSFSAAWTPNTKSGTCTNINLSGINATVNMASTGVIGTFVAPYPQVNVAGDFVVAGSASAVEIDMNFGSKTEYMRTSVVFSKRVSGLKFGVSDIDKTNATSTTYFDSINVKGYFNGQVIYPSLKRFNGASAHINIIGNAAVANTGNNLGGNASSTTKDATSQQATAVIDFGTAVIDSFTVDYGNTTGAQADPPLQAIAMGNITFQRVDIAPVATNFKNSAIPQGNAATAIPLLTATDADGTIASYTITSVPIAAQGVLSVPCPPNITGGTCTGGFTDLTAAVLTANPGGIVLTPTQASSLRFDPSGTFAGTATFNFTAADNTGLLSNTATYALPVTGQPPVSNNVMENSMINTNAATAIQSLNSSDPDGSIASYSITSLPAAAQGVLSVPCPPNIPSGTCTGGFTDLTAAVLSANSNAIVLTPTQASLIRFDPTAAYVGNAIFTYYATDNNANISNTANYTIPVSATTTTARPPLADNVTSQSLNNSLPNTAIPALQGSDLDGAVVSYTVVSIPAAAAGVLRLTCPSLPTGLTCTAGYADIIAGTVLTPAEAGRLYFDPAATFTGTAFFTYTGLDNASNVSNTATYNLPVVNATPVSSNIRATVPFNAPATGIAALMGSDADGTIVSYTLTTVPTAAQGTLSVLCPPNITGGTCTGGFTDLTPAVLAANPSGISLTATQAAGLRFAPFAGYTGNAPFNYTSTDNNGNISAGAVYTVTIAAQPPVTTDITNAALANTAAATAITSLTATDADGTIASYTLLTIPPATQGVLSVPCPPNFTGATCTGGFQNLTEAIQNTTYSGGFMLTPVQAAGLRFDPATGNASMVSFSFQATDNSGYLSNISNYYIPITGTGNIPPSAKNITSAALSNTAAATAISGLSATDADNTIAGYTITSVPTAAQGVLSIPCPATPPGATCTGGFADLTPAVLSANLNAIVLTTAQAAAIRFNPAAGYTGQVNFTYTATDNGGTPATSASATYTIPVTGTPPVANAVTAATMSHAAGATTLSPTLSVTDADGTVASYSIESIPPVAQGVLSVACPPNLTGATCTGGFQGLTAAILAGYPSGIPLTPAQMATLRFAPAANYRGNVVFNYHGTDNSGLLSNSATYTIPVTNLPPVSNEVRSQKIINSATATAIPTLNSTDADGTIASYVITSLPPASQGAIRVPCPPNITGGTCTGGFTILTAAVLTANPGGIVLTPTQAAGLQFAPVATYNGNAIFNYVAYDNNGVVSNTASYIIQTGTAAALPLTLVNFAGTRSGDDVILKWETKNEVNVDRFDVEYSIDGTHFTYAGTVRANNNPSGNYQFTVSNFTQPVGYFRLKSVDKDASFSYSAVVLVRLNGVVKKAILVTPNPASENLQVKISTDVSALADIQVISGTGQVVYQARQQLYRGDNILPMQSLLPRLTKGTYMVRAAISGDVLSARFLVQK